MANEAYELVLGTLNDFGVFTFLAYLLVFIAFFFSFEYVLKMHVKKIEKENKRKLLAVVFSVIVTILLFLAFFPYATDSAAVFGAAAFVIVLLGIVAAILLRMTGFEIPESLKK